MGVEFRSLFLEFLGEEGAEAVGQGPEGQEELFAGADPSALIQGKAPAGNQVVNMGMEHQGAAPGVEHAEHSQLGSQSFGIAGQILEGLGAGGKEQIVTEVGMGANPGAQEIRQSKSDVKVRATR